LGATRSGEVALLDGERRLRYRGRVDARFRLSGEAQGAVREDLLEAVEDVLAGREVRIPETPVEGCLITPPAEPDRASTATYGKDVAPILQRHCQECHRPGGDAPFALTGFEDVRSRARMIAEVVSQQRMPPWLASARHGEFANRRGL